MKKISVLVIVVLVLFGCTSQSVQTGLQSNASSTSNQTALINNSNSSVIPNSSLNNISNTNNTATSNGTVISNITSTSNANNPNSTQLKPEYNFTQVLNPDGRLRVYYFYSTSCSACSAISGFMENVSKQFENRTAWYTYDINTVSGREAYTNFSTTFNLTAEQKYVPAVFFNQTLIWDRFRIEGGLEGNLTRFT